MQLARSASARVATACVLLLATCGQACAHNAAKHSHAEPMLATPLARAHAHNDYAHATPLFDALAQGFTSVEADVWLVDGELLVAHDRSAVTARRSLEALYLQPLRALARAHGGRVYPDFPHSLQLLIDVKSDAEPSYRALHALLCRYADLLTLFTEQAVREAAVTAVVSGARARELMAAQRVRYAGYDGRKEDVGSSAAAAFMPLLSCDWAALFTWRGGGSMPDAERATLQHMVKDAHAHGRRLRFWATPEDRATRESVWRTLVDAHVDYINSDDLAGLRAFLRNYDAHASTPEVTLWRSP